MVDDFSTLCFIFLDRVGGIEENMLPLLDARRSENIITVLTEIGIKNM